MRIFLSHSSHDKPFVRQLHEALTLRGINTFFDERDIRVGDDIRLAIERGVADSTHLIYVISSHSVKSRWVQEELSIGTIKRIGQIDYKIFPALIEKIDLPVGIQHIKYADFRNWELGEPFFSGLREVMTSLGISPEIPGEGGLAFSIVFAPRLQTYETLFRMFSSEAQGMVAGWVDGVAVSSYSYHSLEDIISGMIYKLSLQVGIQSALTSLHEILANSSVREAVEIRELVATLTEHITWFENRPRSLSVDDIQGLARLSKQIADKLAVILRQSLSVAQTLSNDSTLINDLSTG
jgi:TIR domain